MELAPNFVIWHDDRGMASPEEDAKYPLTEEQERYLDERLEKIFAEFGLGEKEHDSNADND